MTMQRILPLIACLLGLGIAPALAASAPPAEHASARYTTALNAFMAHGWHAVNDMHIRNGDVVASAVNSKGQMRSVTFDPNTGKVKQAALF